MQELSKIHTSTFVLVSSICIYYLKQFQTSFKRHLYKFGKSYRQKHQKHFKSKFLLKKGIYNSAVSIPVYPMERRLLEELSEVADLLERIGIFLTVDRYTETEVNSAYDMLRLRINEEQYAKITTWHAGRK